jgi:hypothetical protein
VGSIGKKANRVRLPPPVKLLLTTWSQDPRYIVHSDELLEQVEKVNPDLVVRGEDGKVMTVRYEAVNAMLLNEFLKEHCQVRHLKATIAQQQKEFHTIIAQQQKQIEALATGLQTGSRFTKANRDTGDRKVPECKRRWAVSF